MRIYGIVGFFFEFNFSSEGGLVDCDKFKVFVIMFI